MHTAIYGVTLTGKTTLARELSRMLLKAGQKVIVYDPMGTETAGGGWGEGAIIFDDPDEFLDYINLPEVLNAHLFIDEADEIFSHSHKQNFWLAKKGRHFGFSLYLMSQRPQMIHPTVRGQCAVVYMFRLSMEDQDMVGRDKGHSGFDKIQLDVGDFVKIKSGSPEYKSGNIFSILKGNLQCPPT